MRNKLYADQISYIVGEANSVNRCGVKWEFHFCSHLTIRRLQSGELHGECDYIASRILLTCDNLTRSAC